MESSYNNNAYTREDRESDQFSQIEIHVQRGQDKKRQSPVPNK